MTVKYRCLTCGTAGQSEARSCLASGHVVQEWGDGWDVAPLTASGTCGRQYWRDSVVADYPQYRVRCTTEQPCPECRSASAATSVEVQPNWPHFPAVARRSDGNWGVFCNGCSERDGNYVYPCTELARDEWPPAILYVRDHISLGEHVHLMSQPATQCWNGNEHCMVWLSQGGHDAD